MTLCRMLTVLEGRKTFREDEQIEAKTPPAGRALKSETDEMPRNRRTARVSIRTTQGGRWDMNENNAGTSERDVRRYKLAIVANANGLNVADPEVAEAIWNTDSEALMDLIIRHGEQTADAKPEGYAVGEYGDLLSRT